MLGALELKARLIARRAAFGTVGGLMMLVGLGFATAALLMFLLTQTDPITACLIVAGGFFGIGLICMAIANRRKVVVAPPVAAPAHSSVITPVIMAFVDGLARGMVARSAPPPRNQG